MNTNKVRGIFLERLSLNVLNYVLNSFVNMPLNFSNVALHVIAFTGALKPALLVLTCPAAAAQCGNQA